MSERRPKPLTDPEMDLQDFDHMPLNIKKLMKSHSWAMATGDEAKAMVMLWCRSWHEIPPASLPNNDRILAAWSGLGSQWEDAKEVVLRNFQLCSDGRLYHTTLSKLAHQSWANKRFNKRRTKPATEARWKKGKSNTYDRDGERDAERDAVRDENRNGARDGIRDDIRNEPRREKKEERESKNPSHLDSSTARARDPDDRGDGNSFSDSGWPENTQACVDWFLEERERNFPNESSFTSAHQSLASQAATWLRQGLTSEDVCGVVERGMAWYREKGKGAPRNFGAFNRMLQQTVFDSRRARGVEPESQADRVMAVLPDGLKALIRAYDNAKALGDWERQCAINAQMNEEFPEEMKAWDEGRL